MFGAQNAQSLVGLALTLLVCWLLSEGRTRFPWKLAIGAIAVQIGLVVLLFGVPAAQNMLKDARKKADRAC